MTGYIYVDECQGEIKDRTGIVFSEKTILKMAKDKHIRIFPVGGKLACDRDQFFNALPQFVNKAQDQYDNRKSNIQKGTLRHNTVSRAVFSYLEANAMPGTSLNDDMVREVNQNFGTEYDPIDQDGLLGFFKGFREAADERRRLARNKGSRYQSTSASQAPSGTSSTSGGGGSPSPGSSSGGPSGGGGSSSPGSSSGGPSGGGGSSSPGSSPGSTSGSPSPGSTSGSPGVGTPGVPTPLPPIDPDLELQFRMNFLDQYLVKTLLTDTQLPSDSDEIIASISLVRCQMKGNTLPIRTDLLANAIGKLDKKVPDKRGTSELDLLQGEAILESTAFNKIKKLPGITPELEDLFRSNVQILQQNNLMK